MQLLIRIVVSGVIIGVVSLIARSNPGIGGWLAAMPLTTLITTAWLVSENAATSEVEGFYVAVLVGMAPSALFFVAAIAALRLGASAVIAAAVGVAVWGLCTLVASHFGWLRL